MARYKNTTPVVLDDNGAPIVGAKKYFFETGTSTLKAIYSDSALTIETANPQTSVAGGRYTGDIFLDGIYKEVQEDDNGVILWTKDPVGDVVEGQFELWISSNTYSIPEIALGSDDNYYRSLTDGNQGNDPVSSPINWEQIQFGRVWNTNVTYAIADSSYGSDGFLYFSKTASNLGNDPVSSPDDWERDNSETPDLLNNLSFTAAVATKALTFALKTKNGIDPTSTDSVKIGFRNATLTTGDYSIVSSTAATSLVVPSGGTLGFSAALTDFIYLYAVNNSGTIELAVSNQPLDETILHTTVAITAAADSSNVLYSTTLRSNVPIRQIGRITIETGATAGEWDNAPTNLHVGLSLSPVKPAFSVHRNGTNQTGAGSSAYTKIQFTTEVFDTNSDFDNSTNYRFTPTVAGKYIITCSSGITTITANMQTRVSIYKNGSAHKETNGITSAPVSAVPCVSAVIDFNGSTDYVEFYLYHNQGSSSSIDGDTIYTFATGMRIQ